MCASPAEAEQTYGRFWKAVNINSTPEGLSPPSALSLCTCSRSARAHQPKLTDPSCLVLPYIAGLQVLLDARPLRTPSGKPLVIPHNRAPVAFLIANEWENQKQILKNHALPMVSSHSSLFLVPPSPLGLSLPARQDNLSCHLDEVHLLDW